MAESEEVSKCMHAHTHACSVIASQLRGEGEGEEGERQMVVECLLIVGYYYCTSVTQPGDTLTNPIHNIYNIHAAVLHLTSEETHCFPWLVKQVLIFCHSLSLQQSQACNSLQGLCTGVGVRK